MAESTPGRMDLMPGYEVWEDGTYEMTTGDPGGLSKYYAKDTTEPWYHTVGVQHDDAFIIRPVILREGPFKDHKVLVLEPFTQTFRFLDLPPEIRTMVYGMMLKGTTATVIVSTYKPNHRPRRPCGVTFRDKLQHGEYDWDPVTCNWLGVHAYDDRVRRAIFGLLESAKDLRTIYLPLAMMRKPSDRELPVVMASLIADSRTLLDTRRAARRAGAKEVDPISLFEIDNTRLMCYQCCRKPARPELCRTETARDWDIPCLRIEAHCLAMTARLQSEVARALGMRV
ncbi:hypothetical protein LTR57_010936 [Friedmanniomyces endolithicus]|nr:hypothetical protein LTR57_010936 [Friedmanniomyces endolithicus]